MDMIECYDIEEEDWVLRSKYAYFLVSDCRRILCRETGVSDGVRGMKEEIAMLSQTSSMVRQKPLAGNGRTLHTAFSRN